MRIIDFHTHPVFLDEGNSRKEALALARYARGLGIERMVALGDVLKFGPTPSAAQIKEINDTTVQLGAWVPDFFIPFCYLNPLLGERQSRRELDLRLEQGFKGIKLEIANNARSPVMQPLVQAARESGLPILQHSWDTIGTRARRSHSDPQDTCWLASKNPDVTFVMAHLYGIGRRGVLEAAEIENLYVDTSACLPFAGLIEYAVDALGDGRLLYGSDLPIRELGQCIGRVTGAQISEPSKRRILFDNASQLLESIR